MLALSSASCELAAGIDRLDYVPATVCRLPQDGDAQLRLANMIPGEERVDLCVADTGQSVKNAKSLLDHGKGGSCPGGYSYLDLSQPLGVSAGRHAVKVVAAGKGCGSEGPTLDVTVVKGERQTIVAWGASLKVAKLATHEDATEPGTRIRFLNVLQGTDAVDLGWTALPRTGEVFDASDLFVQAVPLGGVSEARDDLWQPVDARGYITFSGQEAAPVGVAATGMGPQGSVAGVSLAPKKGTTYTLFATGVLDSAAYPPRLWLCEETLNPDQAVARCGDPVRLLVEAYSPKLTDMFTHDVSGRTTEVARQLRESTSDLLCLTETYPTEVFSELAKAATAAGFDVISSKDIVADTSRLQLQDGSEPDLSTAPCAGDERTTEFGALMDCIESNCGEDGRLSGGGAIAAACISRRCAGQVSKLFTSHPTDPQVNRCWLCAISRLAGDEALEDVRNGCLDDPGPNFAFAGDTGLIALVRRHPGRVYLGSQAEFVPELLALPSTNWNRGVLRVPMSLENGAMLDFYCGQLATLETVSSLVYSGPYGDGTYERQGALVEQELQAERFVQWVKERSATRGASAIIAAPLQVAPAVDGDPPLEAINQSAYDTMSNAFKALVSETWTPECTLCRDNPLVQGGLFDTGNAWETHLLGWKTAGWRVLSTERSYVTGQYATSLPSGTGRDLPPSPFYGLRSEIEVSQ